MRTVWIGVDGGGTRTTALVGDRDAAGELQVLGRAEAGAVNPQAVGFETSAATIASAIRHAVASSDGRSSAPIAGITLGIAGASRPNDRARLSQALADALAIPVEQVDVVADIALVLPAAGFTAGIALIAGTGSAAYGVGPDGRTALAGGWGYLIGDDGSAFAVGREALRAILRADDGLGPTTSLADALAAHLGITQPRDLIRVIYQSESPRAAVATLAPLVTEAARRGDAIAGRILEQAGRDLGRIVTSVARRLALGRDAAVVGAGGMFGAGGLLVDPLRADLANAGLAGFQLLEAEPALGALRLAAAAGGDTTVARPR